MPDFICFVFAFVWFLAGLRVQPFFEKDVKNSFVFVYEFVLHAVIFVVCDLGQSCC